MEKSDWILLGLTFVTGMFIGMFMYITSFKPTYIPETLNTVEDTASDFSVIGKTQGGVRPRGYIPPSFRVLGDGSYSYIPGGTGDDSLAQINGKLPKNLSARLKAAAQVSVLDEASKLVSKTECRSYSDGTYHTYQVMLDGDQYDLDICTTAIGYDDELSLALGEVWYYMANPQNGYQGVGGGGDSRSGSPSEKAEEYLRNL